MIKTQRIILWTFIWIILLLLIFEYSLSIGIPWIFSSLEPYLLRKENDDWTHIAFEIQRIKNRKRDPNNSFFIYLGGSAGLESIYSEKIMEKRLYELAKRKIKFKSLSSSYKTFVDEIKIIDELGDVEGIIIIPIEALSFKKKLDVQVEEFLKKSNHNHLKYYFLTLNQNAGKILSDYGYKIKLSDKLYFLKSAKVIGEIIKKRYINKILSMKRIKSVKYNPHAVGDKTPVNEKDKLKNSKWLKKLLEKYKEYYELNLKLLKETIDIAKSNNNKVILVDLPNNPIFNNEISEFYTHYDLMINDLIKEKKVYYIDMRYAANWKPEDFRDVHHMRSFGQKKFSEELAVRLADYLKENTIEN